MDVTVFADFPPRPSLFARPFRSASTRSKRWRLVRPGEPRRRDRRSPRSRIPLQGSTIDDSSAHDVRGAPVSCQDPCQEQIRCADTGSQPRRPGIQAAGLLTSARRIFTLRTPRPERGGGSISTEDGSRRDFLRTNTLVWVEEGVPFCRWGPYNGAVSSTARSSGRSGPPADGAPTRA